MPHARSLYPLVVIAFLTGCAAAVLPINVARYSTNPLAQQVLLEYSSPGVSVGSIDMGPGVGEKLSCLTADIPLPDGATISEFVRSSLIAELGAADQYNPNAQNTISGRVETAELEYTRKLMLAAHGGTWHIKMSLISTNGKSISVESSHSYDMGYLARIDCAIAADYVMPAVQTLIYETVRKAEFIDLY